MDDNARAKAKYIRSKERLLEEFGIVVTKDISDKLDSLYPNDIATENYTRKVIMSRFDN